VKKQFQSKNTLSKIKKIDAPPLHPRGEIFLLQPSPLENPLEKKIGTLEEGGCIKILCGVGNPVLIKNTKNSDSNEGPWWQFPLANEFKSSFVVSDL
jgi:hypothetical protein